MCLKEEVKSITEGFHTLQNLRQPVTSIHPQDTFVSTTQHTNRKLKLFLWSF